MVFGANDGMIRRIELKFDNIAYFSEGNIRHEGVPALKSQSLESRRRESHTFATATVCVTGSLELLEAAVEAEGSPEDVIEAESWAVASAATARRRVDRSILAVSSHEGKKMSVTRDEQVTGRKRKPDEERKQADVLGRRVDRAAARRVQANTARIQAKEAVKPHQ